MLVTHFDHEYFCPKIKRQDLVERSMQSWSSGNRMVELVPVTPQWRLRRRARGGRMRIWFRVSSSLLRPSHHLPTLPRPEDQSQYYQRSLRYGSMSILCFSFVCEKIRQNFSEQRWVIGMVQFLQQDFPRLAQLRWEGTWS